MKKITSLVALFLSFLIISLPVCFAETLSLTYDKNGNLVTGDGFYREYNSLNQLWRIRNGSSITDPVLEDYTYHPVEERVLIKKKYNSSGALIETVYYVNENHVRIVNESGTFDTIYIKHEGQLIAEMRNDSTKIFHHPDHLGSATLVTDESGNEIERFSYTPYGLLLGGGTQSRYGYEGKEHKEGSGSIPTGELAYFSFECLTEDNGYNGTANGAIKTTGKIGYGYEFDGSDDYTDFGTHMDIDSEDSFTYAAWIYTDGLNDDRGVIFGGDYRVRDCFSLEKDGTIRLRLDESPLTSNEKITFGEWNHVVAVYTYDSGNGGTDSTVALYINGVLDKEESPAWDGGVFDSWTTGQRRAGYESAYNYYFDGIIDELGVWKRALSAVEVEELYSYGPSSNGEVDFNFRIYKAEWGIFTQPDSLLPNVYDPQQLNRYAFERGNPYNSIDPDGHFFLHLTVAIIAGIILGIIYNAIERKFNSRPTNVQEDVIQGAVGRGTMTTLESSTKSSINTVTQGSAENLAKGGGKGSSLLVGVILNAEFVGDREGGDTCEYYGGCNEEDRRRRLQEMHFYQIHEIDANLQSNTGFSSHYYYSDTADTIVKEGSSLYGSKGWIDSILDRLHTWYKKVTNKRSSDSQGDDTGDSTTTGETG